LTVNNVAPTLGGTQTLFVEASDLDSDGRVRWGDPAEFIFKVELGTATVGRWHFDDAAPGSTVTTVVDTGEVGTRHAATLMDTAGAGWSGLGRRGADDYSLWLNDSTDTARQSGWAATSVPVVNTQESFTVSAWVYLTDTSANRVVLSAPGAHGSAFALYYSSSYNKWVFNRTATDVASNAVALRSLADTTAPPLRVWTHLAAVFDTHDDAVATNDTIQLYVNGRPQGSPVVLSSLSSAYTPWASTEGLQFGRSKSTDSTYGSYFRGRIDEVQVWQRKLDPAEVMEQSQLLESSVPATEMVASWDATTAAGTSIGEGTQYPPGAMALSGSGARLDTDDNNLVLDGTAGYASVTGPVVDETGSFTVTASAMLDNTKFASKPVGYRAQIVGQQAGGKESSWALWAQKVDDGVYLWWFSRTAVDTSGAVTATASVPSAEAAETGTWVQLTGVYDAADGRLHLYVGSEDQPPEDNADFIAVEQGSGELAAGRGTAGGTTGNYLPGALQEVRIWTGAMTADQVSSQVIGDPDGT